MMTVERNAAPNTLAAYGRDLADAEAFLQKRGGLMGCADAPTVEAYFADLAKRGLSPATASRRRSAVRQFYRFAMTEGWVKEDPSRRVDAPKRGRPLPKILSLDEIGAIVTAAAAKDGPQGVRLACMIELLYASGLRVSELIALRLDAVKRDPAPT